MYDRPSGGRPAHPLHDARRDPLRVRRPERHPHPDSDELVVLATGELDAALGSTFDGVLHTVARSTAATRLDFRGVTFCGSEGVHMLLRLHLASRGRVIRFGAAACVRRALDLCGDPLPRLAVI